MTQANEKFIYINGHRIAYLEQGKGPPVILIHGIPTSNLLWRRVMPKLAATRKVYAPDMLNYGQSDKPLDANVSIAAQSRLIVKFMDQLKVKSADLVAHDIGGGVAQLMAVNDPERVRKLVLIDSVCFDSWPIPEFLPLQEAEAEESMTLDQFVTMMRQFMPRGVFRRCRNGASPKITGFGYTLRNPLAVMVQSALKEWGDDHKVRRLWSHDASLWTGNDEGQWLGWLGITDDLLAHLQPLIRLGDEVQQAGFSHVVVLGMGGSSLCPAVMALTFGEQPGFPELHVLDSTDPAQIMTVKGRVDLRKTSTNNS